MRQDISTQNLLDSIMSGQKVSSKIIDELLESNVSEDLFIEYKNSAILRDRKEACKTIRKYTSGFANSSGGILIVGINELEHKVTPCEILIPDDLTDWASRCLTEIAHYFSPPPRFQVVNHEDGKILIIATTRSLNLVPCIEKGELIYYIRFHDQTLNNKTLRIPDYLLADLILGRRQRPYITITNYSITPSSQEIKELGKVVEFPIIFTIENGSLAWANEITLGIICYNFHQEIPLSNHLLSHIDLNDIEDLFNEDVPINIYRQEINSYSGMKVNLDPFGLQRLSFKAIRLPARILGRVKTYILRAAIYIMSKEIPPIWYQVDVHINSDFLIAARDGKQIHEDSSLIKIERLTNKRPIVDLVDENA